MLLAIDVHYKENYAKVIGVLFNWEDKAPHPAACIRQLAKDEKITISEKEIRAIARTDLEDGTQADGMIDAMIDVFGKDKLEIKMKYDPNISDADMLRQIASDNNM